MKTATSSPNANSSATAAPSFVLDGNPPNAKLAWLKTQREYHQTQLTELEATPVPVPKLYIKARNSNISRMKTLLRDIDEAISWEENKTKV